MLLIIFKIPIHIERERERERESHHSLPSCVDQHRVSKQKQEQKAPATNLSAQVCSVPACHSTKNEIRLKNLPKKILYSSL
jgi:hypothetical protein